MIEQFITTLHPRGKTGRKIHFEKYTKMKLAIMQALRGKELTHDELFTELAKRLADTFDGDVNWYGETVKLDLEARNIIDRTQDKPQKYYLL